MKHINKAIPLGTAFILGAGAGWIVKGSLVSFLFTYYVPAIVTLLAAYYGAKYAFEFQREKEQQVIDKKNMVSGNLAIFKLVTMINSLLSYQRQIINPVRNKPTAFLEMSPTLPQSKDNISIDIDSLSFLLGMDEQNLVGELSVEEARYDAAISAINERSRLHRNEIQPALEAANIKNGGSYSLDEINSALGERMFQTLQLSTRQVILQVDTTIVSLKTMSDKLTKALRDQFPNERIISVSIPDEYSESEENA